MQLLKPTLDYLTQNEMEAMILWFKRDWNVSYLVIQVGINGRQKENESMNMIGWLISVYI